MLRIRSRKKVSEMNSHVIIFIPTLTAGGAERVASVLANEWCENNKVTIVTYFETPQFYSIDPRVTVICLGFRPHRSKISRVVDVALATFLFRRAVCAVRPEFVLSFMNKYNSFAIASLLGTGTPVIISERDSPTEALPWMRTFARDMLYPLAAGVICQTQKGLDFITTRMRVRKATVIPNPIPRVIHLSERRPEAVVLSIGRLVEKKAIDQLIRAFGAMVTPGWRLVICGDGPLRSTLESQVRTCDLAGRVEFVGMTQDLATFHRRAGIFALSSLYEGFPNALAEAVTSGIPSVAYDCPTGPSELIDDGISGRLVPVGDWKALARAMDEIASDNERAEAYSRASSSLGSHLDASQIAHKFLSFCQTAAQAKEQ